jgi:hypothetical protein
MGQTESEARWAISVVLELGPINMFLDSFHTQILHIFHTYIDFYTDYIHRFHIYISAIYTEFIQQLTPISLKLEP